MHEAVTACFTVTHKHISSPEVSCCELCTCANVITLALNVKISKYYFKFYYFSIILKHYYYIEVYI